MAATTSHTSTPEPFPQLEGPTAATSLSSNSTLAPTNRIHENTNLLRPHSPQRIGRTSPELSPKSQKHGLSPRSTPAPLTGQAAMAEIKRRKLHKPAEELTRQTSPNASVEAMHALMGGGGMSKMTDAPAPDKLSEPLRKVAEKINVPTGARDTSQEASPVSVGSFGTIESTTVPSALTATASNLLPPTPQFVAEPAQMTDTASYPPLNNHLAVAGENNKTSYSYPGPPPPQDQNQHEGGPSRGMSLPGYGQGSPKSPSSSNKRHKCPYCATDFTRHHNLKSHLLTHSQEKPYVCQTCQARFRRLHDLKRHTKLHTGERPHTCDKCGRRFARGDALARHNKGPGGCAGRRSSFGGDDDFGGEDPHVEGMDGVEYAGGEDDEDLGPEEQGRRVSEPSHKRSHLETPQDRSREVYRPHSSTYPPVQGRPHPESVSNMGPPTVIHPGGNTTTSPREMSGQPSPPVGSLSSSYYPPGQVFQQQGIMTESPKPLSPGQPSTDQHRLSVTDVSMSSIRNRSPSLTTQFQQQHFGRKSGGGSPHPSQPQYPTSQQVPPGAPVLPPLGGGQPQGRPGYQPSSLTSGPGSSMPHHQQVLPGQSSLPGSLSSQGRSSGSSLREAMDPGDIWGYVRSLEQRFSRMQDEYELRISRLQEEVISLKGQVSNAASYSSDMQQPPPRY